MFKELEAESQFLQVEIEFLQGQISQEAYEKAKENKGLNKQVKEEGDRRQRAMAAAEAQQGRRRSTESQAKNAREQVPDDDHLDFKKLLGAAKGAVGALRENREKLAMVVGRQINRKLDKRGIIESSYEAPLQGPAGDNRKPTRGQTDPFCHAMRAGTLCEQPTATEPAFAIGFGEYHLLCASGSRHYCCWL
ncbi:unnamed protein product [Polarella glacialis]|uniref:Uncharacterized protein n=1 Tax=Polarella glacialis TaxID=89957 RepID=A0A813L789_POLGL|nr:unnamed protein product [Polarella glacialis]